MPFEVITPDNRIINLYVCSINSTLAFGIKEKLCIFVTAMVSDLHLQGRNEELNGNRV